MSIKAIVTQIEPKIQISDSARLDVQDFGAIGDGHSHPLEERYGTNLEAAQKDFPHAESVSEEIDWAAIQAALNRARDLIQATLDPVKAESLFRTAASFAPTVFVPPGQYVSNRPLMVYPHTSIEGADWGHSIITLEQTKGWATTAQPMTINPGGLWIKDYANPKASALLWHQADEEWPVGSGLKVSNMVNSVTRLGLKCWNGAAIYLSGNANQLEISSCWLNGYGDGATGLGFVLNNKSSSTQVTNLFFRDNFVEGCQIGFLADRIEQGAIQGNQFDSVKHGVYVGHGSNLIISDNSLANAIGSPGQFQDGIWVGLGCPCQIVNNIIAGVSSNAIKLRGRATSVSGNIIRIVNGALLTSSGYGIHIVTGAHQFGGDSSALGGQEGPHLVQGNVIDCDKWPDPSLKSLWFEDAPGEILRIKSYNNIESPI